MYQSFIFNFMLTTHNDNQVPFFTFKWWKRSCIYKGKSGRPQLERILKSITTQKSQPSFFINTHQSWAGLVSSHSWKLVNLLLYATVRDVNLASWWRSSSIISRMETGLKYVFVWSNSKLKLWLRKSISYDAENPKKCFAADEFQFAAKQLDSVLRVWNRVERMPRSCTAHFPYSCYVFPLFYY